MRFHVEAVWLALLLAAAAALLTAGAERIGFQSASEREHAQVGREIDAGSSFIVLHRLGNPYPEKPPLYFWIEAAAFKLTGRSDPFAARLPMIALGMLALLFAYLTMRQIDGPRVALIGTAALLVSFRFFYEARQVETDLPMCAFTWGAFWASTRIMFPARGREGGGFVWVWLAWTLSALAMLTNGVGALVWPGTLVVYAIAGRQYGPLRWHWFWAGLAWMLGAFALWLVPAATMGGPDYYGPMLRARITDQFYGVLSAMVSILYYFYKLPSDALPMGLMIPASLWWAWRRRRRVEDGGRTRFALCWLLFGFVFFSIPREKHGANILPVYPAAALLVARLIVAGFQAKRPRRVVYAHAWLMSLMMLLAAPAIIGLFKFRPEVFMIDPPAKFMILLLATLALGGAAAGWSLRHGRLATALAAIGATAYLSYIILFVYFMPDLHNDRVPRQIAQELNHRAAAGEALGFYKLDSAASLYTHRLPQWLITAEAARAFMANEDQRWLLTTVKALDPNRNPGWPIVRQWTETTGEDAVVMLSNRAPKLPEVLYESSDTSDTFQKSEIRNPKSNEVRKSEIRNSKSETDSNNQ